MLHNAATASNNAWELIFFLLRRSKYRPALTFHQFVSRKKPRQQQTAGTATVAIILPASAKHLDADQGVPAEELAAANAANTRARFIGHASARPTSVLSMQTGTQPDSSPGRLAL